MKIRSLTLFVIFLFTTFLNQNVEAQQDMEPYMEPYKNFVLQKSDCIETTDSLFQIYGQNKTFPTGLELECLLALSYYPELKQVKINFIRKKIPHIMRSQPSKKFSSFLRHPVAKSYNIYISSNTDPAKNATLEELSFNAVVGILGHELGHVVQYLKRPMTDFAAYLFDKKMKKIIEREADQITINHGLGYALYDARYYSLHVSNRAKDKNESTLEFYYKAEEVLQATIRHFNDN